MTLNYMQAGGAYTLILTNTSAGYFNFSGANPTVNAANFTYQPSNGTTVTSGTAGAAGKGSTVYTFIYANGYVFVSWITGF
jgi:hypothetical protein